MSAPFRRPATLLAVAWLVILLVVVGVGWLLTHPFAGPVGSRENDLSKWIADRRTDSLTSWAHAFTVPGNTVVALCAGLVLAVALVAWRREWSAALLLVLGLGGVYGIYLVAVTLVPRDRPPVDVLDPGLVPDHSFPSGHVAAATVLYGGVAVLVTVLWPALVRWLVPVLVLVPFAVLVSRLYLGAHHLSDTLTSLVFAAAWLLVLTRVIRPGRPREPSGAS
jgi:membrane-associated phospholipid phosphatase